VPGGGWNAGNSIAFGVPYAPYYAPYRDATSIALLPLSSQAHEWGVQASLSWLAARLAGCPSPYSLAWGILALTAYRKKNSEANDALPCATDALIAAILKDTSALDTSTLAICLLAIEAVEGHLQTPKSGNSPVCNTSVGWGVLLLMRPTAPTSAGAGTDGRGLRRVCEVFPTPTRPSKLAPGSRR
jgi:hypothetical protein